MKCLVYYISDTVSYVSPVIFVKLCYSIPYKKPDFKASIIIYTGKYIEVDINLAFYKDWEYEQQAAFIRLFLYQCIYLLFRIRDESLIYFGNTPTFNATFCCSLGIDFTENTGYTERTLTDK